MLRRVSLHILCEYMRSTTQFTFSIQVKRCISIFWVLQRVMGFVGDLQSGMCRKVGTSSRTWWKVRTHKMSDTHRSVCSYWSTHRSLLIGERIGECAWIILLFLQQMQKCSLTWLFSDSILLRSSSAWSFILSSLFSTASSSICRYRARVTTVSVYLHRERETTWCTTLLHHVLRQCEIRAETAGCHRNDLWLVDVRLWR